MKRLRDTDWWRCHTNWWRCHTNWWRCHTNWWRCHTNWWRCHTNWWRCHTNWWRCHTMGWGVAGLALLALAAESVPREALRAWQRGDRTTAERLLRAAADTTPDPGHVAYNLATLLAEQGEYREAEQLYRRVLADDCLPPGRRIRALYNRGVCLLQRNDVASLRLAIDCLVECRDTLERARDPIEHDLTLGDKHDRATERRAQLLGDVRHNLALAKLLWQQARQSQPHPPLPNDTPNDPANDPSRGGSGDSPWPSTPSDDPRTARAEDRSKDPRRDDSRRASGGHVPPADPLGSGPTDPPTDAATATAQTLPAAGPLPVLPDTETVLKLSPHDTEALLQQIAARLRTARQQNEQLRAGPERPNVRDW